MRQRWQIALSSGHTPHTAEDDETSTTEVPKVNLTGATRPVSARMPWLLHRKPQFSGGNVNSLWRGGRRVQTAHSAVTGSVVLQPRALGPQSALKAESAFVLFHVAGDAAVKRPRSPEGCWEPAGEIHQWDTSHVELWLGAFLCPGIRMHTLCFPTLIEYVCILCHAATTRKWRSDIKS